MNAVGIVCEYNPFHKGHLHHLNQVKEMYPDNVIVLVLSTSFTQRGNVSVLSKWGKTKIALHYGVDIVIELPFAFSVQNADKFSYGSLNILNHMKVKKIVFGSESNDVDKLINLANKQLDIDVSKDIKFNLSKGLNYPKSLYNAYNENGIEMSSTPNDILGICYIKEIIKNKYDIKPITIKRTNSYHSEDTNNEIISATAARRLIKEEKSLKKYLPGETLKYLKSHVDTDKKYFELLKYKIINLSNSELREIQDVDEGIENRLKKYIWKSNNLEEYINKIKTKRYTRNKITRMFTHIITNYKRDENEKNNEITYLRVLGYSKKGQVYLNSIKKKVAIPIITNYKNIDDGILKTELKVTQIYSILNNKDFMKLETNKKAVS